MEKQDIKDKVAEALKEFELLEELQPAAGWNEALMGKLRRTERRYSSTMPRTAIVVVTMIILVNLAILISQLKPSTGFSDGRDAELKIISRELLSNPLSLRD